MPRRLSLVIVLACLLAGCGSAATPTVAPTIAQAPTAAPPPPTANIQATVDAAVKATTSAAPTAPPTAAPTPSPALSPTAVVTLTVKPAQTSGQWTVDQVIAAFKSAGLEAEAPKRMAREDYGMAPLVGEGVRFLIPSLCADCGGRVFAVPVVAERDRLAGYYQEMGKASAAFFSHVFVRDNIVVQINGDMKDDQAAKYETALKGMR